VCTLHLAFCSRANCTPTHFSVAGAKVEPSVFHTMPLKALKQEVSLYENKFNRMVVTTLRLPPPVSDVLHGAR
jgi:hypothetical protein